jgi:homospermidine synthase
MHKIPFNGRLLIMGYGSVSQCTLPLVLKHFDMPKEKITVLDMEDYNADVSSLGVRFVQEKITEENLQQILAKYVGRGDLIIDLTWNIECNEILDWCHNNEVLYANTSVEKWDPYANAKNARTTDRTLYVRQMALRKLINSWGNKKGTTAVVDHGANPGLVSHFTKVGLIDIAEKILAEKPNDPRAGDIRSALEGKQYNKLSQLVGVKVIHISERDTQISSRPKEVNEFVNTWSIEGFYEEGTAPAEMGWGTHEHILPPGARLHQNGPRNQICLARYGINTWVRSWVPCGEILGMVIRHGEAFSISDYLTVNDDLGSPVYRPTVHYAYCPCDAAIASLHELRMRNYKMQENLRIMDDDITSGRDELGVLIMGHDFKSWWVGSLLDIEETRQLVPGQNATTLQVAISVLACASWMIKNPNEGVNLPDQLPHDEILDIAKPYLGPFVSKPVNWTPEPSSPAHHGVTPDGDLDIWQFHNFLITEDLTAPAEGESADEVVNEVPSNTPQEIPMAEPVLI